MDPDPEPLFILLISVDPTTIISIAVLIVLLMCSALISGAEVAFFSLSPSDLLETEEQVADRKMLIVKKLLTKPKKLLATILVANNAINIAIVLLFASLGEVIFSNITAEILGIPLTFFTRSSAYYVLNFTFW